MACGRLYVVATPIGNLDDISMRALGVLKSVALIAAEDTRHSAKLLRHYAIDTPLTSYHEHNESEKAADLIAKLQQGLDVALITDAGTPCISDPGFRIVRLAQEAGVPVLSIPGPCAAVAALSISGLPTDRFMFHGFFPRKHSESLKYLHSLLHVPATHVFYESPNRIEKSLTAIRDRMPHAEICLARELTKTFEELLRGTAHDLLQHIGEHDVRGECVLLISVPEDRNAGPALSRDELRDRVQLAMTERGLSKRDAVRVVASESGMSRNEVYAAAVDTP